MVSKNLRTLITAAMLTVFSGHMVMAGNPLTSDSFENVAPRSSVVEVVPVSKVKAEAPVKDKKQEVALQLLEEASKVDADAIDHVVNGFSKVHNEGWAAYEAKQEARKAAGTAITGWTKFKDFMAYLFYPGAKFAVTDVVIPVGKVVVPIVLVLL
jgi:hypothetical protein